MSKNNGGPAFPRRPYIGKDAIAAGVSDDIFTSGHHGMSLRDWFAGKADVRQHNPIGGLTQENAQALNGTAMPEDRRARLKWWADARAAWRYMEADSMIAEREKGGGDA